MSKESKPRDRWSQVFTSAASRPSDYCPGCGYYAVANGEHRTDCTRDQHAPQLRQLADLGDWST